ncbi:MAG: DUF2029 domain-containing protein [Nitrososphaerota archaeon]|nr:DUF2029 domain-containing protein [Nitrososphaerota archaeon]
MATLVILGSIIEIILLALVISGKADNWSYLSLGFAIAFVVYLFSLFFVGKVGFDSGRKSFAIVFTFSAAFIITISFSQPFLSWDVFRYYWDGKVLANGINPFMYAPDASQLSFLRDSLWININHKDLWTPYPPFSQLIFVLTYLAWPALASYRIDAVILDLLVVTSLYYALKKMNQPPINALTYGWSPLVIVEMGQSSHNDALSVLMVVLSFLLLLMDRPVLSSLALGLATISKYYPLLLAPLFFRKWGVKGIIVYIGVVVLSYIPFLGAGMRIFNGMMYIANTQLYTSSVFPFFQWIARLMRASNPGQAAQYLDYVIFICIFAFALKKTVLSKDSGTADLWKYSFVVIGALLLLNRALFPWYVVWILPFLSSIKSKAWLVLTGTVMVGYFQFTTFPPPDNASVPPVISALLSLAEYLPFFVILAYEMLSRRSSVNKEFDENISSRILDRM